MCERREGPVKKRQSHQKKFLNRRNPAAEVIASKRWKLEREIMNRFRKLGAGLAMALTGCLWLMGFSGCETAATLVSSTHFSQSAYDTDKQLKDESLALIDKATNRTRYSSVAADVTGLMQKIDSAI